MGAPSIEAGECRSALDFILERMDPQGKAQPAMEQLLEHSGFPEPFMAQGAAFHQKWSREYLDRVITEDIGLLTRVADREKLHDLYHLLPEMVGSPISENSRAASSGAMENLVRARREKVSKTVGCCIFRIFCSSNRLRRKV